MHINPNDLIKKLQSLPTEIYEREKQVIQAKESLELAKMVLEVAQAKALLAAEKPNATEKKAYAVLMTEDAKTALIKAQMEYDRQTAHLNSLTNHFIALRKISSIEEALMKVGVSGN